MTNTDKIKTIILWIITIIAVILSIFPIAYLLMLSIKPPELTFAPEVWLFTPTLENYEAVFEGGDFFRYLLNSLVVGFGTMTIALTLGTMAAYGFARFKFRGSFWLRMGSLIPQMLPPITIIVPLYVLFMSLNLLDTQAALIISYLTFTLPLTIWMMTGFFEDIPIELEESAMVDGANRFVAFFRVNLPIAAPGLAATAVLSFIYAWNEFLYAVILTGRNSRTLPVTITSYMTNRAILWGRIAAAGSIVLIPVLIFAILTQRYLVRGLAGGAVKG
ncbi:carbohydrate ABC transporter permease [Chloroflexota bacterium]